MDFTQTHQIYTYESDGIFPEGHPALNDSCTHIVWHGTQEEFNHWSNTPMGAMSLFEAQRQGDVYVRIKPISTN